MIKSLLIAAAASLVFLAAGEPPAATTTTPTRVGYAWPLSTCVVSGDPLGETMVVKILVDAKDPSVHGREVRFCCEKCIATFDANRTKYLKEADAAIVARELAIYPLSHCVIMPDETLAKDGTEESKENRSVIVGNQLVRTCCAQCERKVKRNPTAALAKLQTAAIAAQVATYPLKTCLICSKALPATPADTLIAGRLVRFCCNDCKDKAEKNPATTLALVDAAAKKD